MDNFKEKRKFYIRPFAVFIDDVKIRCNSLQSAIRDSA